MRTESALSRAEEARKQKVFEGNAPLRETQNQAIIEAIARGDYDFRSMAATDESPSEKLGKHRAQSTSSSSYPSAGSPFTAEALNLQKKVAPAGATAVPGYFTDDTQGYLGNVISQPATTTPPSQGEVTPQHEAEAGSTK